MAIQKPGKRLGAHVALKQAQKQMKARGKRAQFAGLMLTSMVDMFTLLVIFLLSNFCVGRFVALRQRHQAPRSQVDD